MLALSSSVHYNRHYCIKYKKLLKNIYIFEPKHWCLISLIVVPCLLFFNYYSLVFNTCLFTISYDNLWGRGERIRRVYRAANNNRPICQEREISKTCPIVYNSEIYIFEGFRVVIRTGHYIKIDEIFRHLYALSKWGRVGGERHPGYDNLYCVIHLYYSAQIDLTIPPLAFYNSRIL